MRFAFSSVFWLDVYEDDVEYNWCLFWGNPPKIVPSNVEIYTDRPSCRFRTCSICMATCTLRCFHPYSFAILPPTKFLSYFFFFKNAPSLTLFEFTSFPRQIQCNKKACFWFSSVNLIDQIWVDQIFCFLQMATEESVVQQLVDRISFLLEKYPIENKTAAKLNQEEISQHEIREKTEGTLITLSKTKLETILEKIGGKLEKVRQFVENSKIKNDHKKQCPMKTGLLHGDCDWTIEKLTKKFLFFPFWYFSNEPLLLFPTKNIGRHNGTNRNTLDWNYVELHVKCALDQNNQNVKPSEFDSCHKAARFDT